MHAIMSKSSICSATSAIVGSSDRNKLEMLQSDICFMAIGNILSFNACHSHIAQPDEWSGER